MSTVSTKPSFSYTVAKSYFCEEYLKKMKCIGSIKKNVKNKAGA